MSDFLWRVIYAVIVVVLLLALIPLLFDVVGFTVSGSVMQILRICIAGLAVLYVFRGRWPV